MSALLGPVLIQRFFDANGIPLVGGKLWCYAAGSTVPAATWTDDTGTVNNSNPIILDANGQCSFWLGNGFFKFILMDANDVIQWTRDRVSVGPTVTTEVSWQKVTIPYTALQTAALSNTLTLFTKPAGSVIQGLIIKHSVAFAGTSITAVKAQIGILGDAGRFIDQFDIFQAASDSANDNWMGQYLGSISASVGIPLTVTAVGANLSALSAGSIDVYYRILPL